MEGRGFADRRRLCGQSAREGGRKLKFKAGAASTAARRVLGALRRAAVTCRFRFAARAHAASPVTDPTLTGSRACALHFVACAGFTRALSSPKSLFCATCRDERYKYHRSERERERDRKLDQSWLLLFWPARGIFCGDCQEFFNQVERDEFRSER